MERLQTSELHVLAEQLRDITTKNTALKAFTSSMFKTHPDGSWRSPHVGAMRVVYGGTPPNSSMRRLLVDAYTTFCKDRYIEIINASHRIFC